MAGAVTALPAEARSLGLSVRLGAPARALADGTLVCVGGMGGPAAASAARALIGAGVAGLASVGMAGALDPKLAAGDVALPSAVLRSEGGRLAANADWRATLARTLGGRCRLTSGLLLTHAGPVDTVAAKSSAFRRWGADAVDMESYAVAEVAALHGVPFIAVRVIVDTANDALPKAVTAASRAGKLSLLRLFGGLLVAPREFAALIPLVGRYRAACASLRVVGRSGLGEPPT